MDRRQNQKGFTLLEVIITVIIVGVVMAAAIPRIGQAVEKFRAQEAVSLIQNLSAAQERYYIDNGQYYFVDSQTFNGLDMSVPSLQYFDSPSANGTSVNSWKVTAVRSDSSYELFTDKAYGPEGIHCADAPGGPNARDICKAMGFPYWKVAIPNNGGNTLKK